MCIHLFNQIILKEQNVTKKSILSETTLSISVFVDRDEAMLSYIFTNLWPHGNSYVCKNYVARGHKTHNGRCYLIKTRLNSSKDDSHQALHVLVPSVVHFLWYISVFSILKDCCKGSYQETQHPLNHGGWGLTAFSSTWTVVIENRWLFCRYTHFTLSFHQCCAVLSSVSDIRRALWNGTQQGSLLSPFPFSLSHSQPDILYFWDVSWGHWLT